MRPSRQSTWILKRESPSPSASSPRPIVRPSRRTRSQPPTKRSRSPSLTSTGPGGKVVTLSTLLPTPPPTFPLARSTATPRKRFASSGNEKTTATATAQVSIVRSTTAKSSRSNSLGIAQYPSASVAQFFPWMLLTTTDTRPIQFRFSLAFDDTDTQRVMGRKREKTRKKKKKRKP